MSKPTLFMCFNRKILFSDRSRNKVFPILYSNEVFIGGRQQYSIDMATPTLQSSSVVLDMSELEPRMSNLIVSSSASCPTLA